MWWTSACNVNIHGMAVRSGDLIHADRHGAVVVPLNTIDGMKAAADKLAAKEARDHQRGEVRRGPGGDQGGDEGLNAPRRMACQCGW